MNRRKFLKWAAAAVAAPTTTAAYGAAEAGWLRVVRKRVVIPRLPPAFAGLTVGLLTDPHHGPFNSLPFIRHAAALLQAQKPDLIALAGDYVQQGGDGPDHIDPCLEVLGRLRAPLGVYAVPGNHDHWGGAVATRAAMARHGLIDVTNSGVWIERGAGRLRVCGVDDLWNGKQDLAAALGDAEPWDSALLLSHNPDYAETVRDERVGLVLSGHMHGGQIGVPGMNLARIPSAYGLKYLCGLVQAPRTLVYVSRGVGTVSLPMRVGARPEVNLLTLIPDKL